MRCSGVLLVTSEACGGAASVNSCQSACSESRVYEQNLKHALKASEFRLHQHLHFIMFFLSLLLQVILSATTASSICCGPRVMTSDIHQWMANSSWGEGQQLIYKAAFRGIIMCYCKTASVFVNTAVYEYIEIAKRNQWSHSNHLFVCTMDNA